MKEFSNKIQIVPVDDILSIDGTTISLTEGKSVTSFFSKNDILPVENPAKKDGQPYFSQSLNVISEKLGNDILNKYLDRKVILKLFTSENTEVLLGSLSNPARCTATPDINADTLLITCESPLPQLS